MAPPSGGTQRPTWQYDSDSYRNTQDNWIWACPGSNTAKVGFEKIIKLIDELVATLKEEQKEDDAKKDYCEKEIDKTEDTKKVLENKVSNLETAIDDASESITNLKAEIEALDDGICALNKEVAEATEQCKEEHDDFEATYAAIAAAVDLLGFAKNRLNKFYNPSQYKAPPKRQLFGDEQITLNMGGTLARTEESAGAITMIDTLINDVDKENQVMKLEEEDAQSDYEKFMSDAKAKRAEDSKSMSDAEGALAETNEQMVNDKGTLGDTQNELMETEKYLGELHGECDWLLKYYDVRAEASYKAKDVLNGAV